MLTELSILIPTYNNRCLKLVKELKRQADAAAKNNGIRLRYEIIVADDGSTDTAAVEHNKAANSLDGCRYITRRPNCGRAAIRNFLAREAGYDNLLFIDSHMTVCRDTYIESYLHLDNLTVAYGGYTVEASPDTLKHSLRCIYEMKYAGNRVAAIRRKHPYKDFHTSNFIIRRDIMLDNPFDERFRRYGYEDVFFGKTLCKKGIPVAHINNPLAFDSFESNASFIAKTEEGIATLLAFRNELEGYSSLIDLGNRLRRLHLLPLATAAKVLLCKPLKRNLTGQKPRLAMFYLYKAVLYAGGGSLGIKEAKK